MRAASWTCAILLRPTLDMVAHVEPLGITQGFGDHWLKYIGYKAWVDGIMGGSERRCSSSRPRTIPEQGDCCARSCGPKGATAPRRDDARAAIHRAPAGQHGKLLVQAARSGLTPHVHAIGDKAVRILLDVYERVLTRGESCSAPTIGGA